MKRFYLGLALSLAAAVMVGCDDSSTDYESYNEAATSDGSHGGHSHAHEKGPHDGKILEMTSDHSVHGELCLDEGGKSLTFYVLGGDLKTPKLAESIEFEIEDGDDEKELPSTPKPLEGEEDGKCSCFAIDASSLGEISDLDSLHAHVHVVIDGKEYEGAVGHDDHGEHGHDDHDDHDHDTDHKHEDGDHDEKHEHDDDHDHEHGDEDKK